MELQTAPDAVEIVFAHAAFDECRAHDAIAKRPHIFAAERPRILAALSRVAD